MRVEQPVGATAGSQSSREGRPPIVVTLRLRLASVPALPEGVQDWVFDKRLQETRDHIRYAGTGLLEACGHALTGIGLLSWGALAQYMLRTWVSPKHRHVRQYQSSSIPMPACYSSRPPTRNVMLRI